MTQLQTIRESLMKQLQNIEDGKAKQEDVDRIISISDCVTKSYNTELRAKELEVSAIGTSVKTDDLDVFKNMQ